MTRDKFLENARSIHGYKYSYIDLPDKLTYKDYIKLELNSLIFNQRVSKHLEGKCPEKNTPKKTIDQFIKESISIWEDRFDYSNMEYNGSLGKVKIFDKYQGRFIYQLATIHLSGRECKDLSMTDFIEMSRLVSDDRYSYNKCEYINKTTKVILNCTEHGEFKIHPFNHLNYGDICKKCISYLSKKESIRFFNKYNINYKREHKFIDCQNLYQLPFDFYISSIRTCIDFVDLNNDFLEINNKIKSDYCEDNYINLIRIRYDQFDDIYQILWDNLSSHIKRLKLR